MPQISEIGRKGFFRRKIENQRTSEWEWLPLALLRLSNRGLIYYQRWKQEGKNYLEACENLAVVSRDILTALDKNLPEGNNKKQILERHSITKFQCDLTSFSEKLLQGKSISSFEWDSFLQSHEILKTALTEEIKSSFEILKELVDDVKDISDGSTLIKESEKTFFGAEIKNVKP